MATNTHGLTMTRLNVIVKASKGIGPGEYIRVFYDRETGTVDGIAITNPDLDTYDYGHGRFITFCVLEPITTQALADKIAEKVVEESAFDLDCEYPLPSDDKPPYHGGVESITWCAYGDWITYKDGTTEYRSIGE